MAASSAASCVTMPPTLWRSPREVPAGWWWGCRCRWTVRRPGGAGSARLDIGAVGSDRPTRGALGRAAVHRRGEPVPDCRGRSQPQASRRDGGSHGRRLVAAGRTRFISITSRSVKSRRLPPVSALQELSGDQAGSDASVGVGAAALVEAGDVDRRPDATKTRRRGYPAPATGCSEHHHASVRAKVGPSTPSPRTECARRCRPGASPR